LRKIIDKSIFKKAWRIAWPLMVAESINSILWITDTFFVSRLGYKAVASVGLAGYISWLLSTIGFMTYMGSLVLVSQAWGAGLIKEGEEVAGEALTFNLMLSLPIMFFGLILAKPLLRVLGASEEVEILGYNYIRARILELLPVYSALVLDSVYRAVGITKPVLYATLYASIANAVLDPVLIYGIGFIPSLGVAGAGFASALASSLYLLLLAHQQRRLRLRAKPKLPSKKVVKVLALGAPYLGEELALVGGNLGYIGSVARCGTVALAAHTIGVRIESLAFLPMGSFATAGGSLVGHEIGAERYNQAEKIGWEVSKANLFLGLLIGTLLASLGKEFAKPFTSDMQVLKLTAIYLLIAGLTEPPLAMAMSLAQAIRNAGNTVTPTVLNISSLIILRVIPAYIIPEHLPRDICVMGAWLAMALDVGGRGAIFTFIYRKWFMSLSKRVI
jgi:putative MATE family efflux protein